MRKTAVVYWSGTGNTQMMAEKVAEGVRAAGAEADVYNCTEFSADLMDNYEAVAFGCPSMGSEQLEDTSSATKHRTTKQTQRALRLARSSQANNL